MDFSDGNAGSAKFGGVEDAVGSRRFGHHRHELLFAAEKFKMLFDSELALDVRQLLELSRYRRSSHCISRTEFDAATIASRRRRIHLVE